MMTDDESDDKVISNIDLSHPYNRYLSNIPHSVLMSETSTFVTSNLSLHMNLSHISALVDEYSNLLKILLQFLDVPQKDTICHWNLAENTFVLL